MPDLSHSLDYFPAAEPVYYREIIRWPDSNMLSCNSRHAAAQTLTDAHREAAGLQVSLVLPDMHREGRLCLETIPLLQHVQPALLCPQGHPRAAQAGSVASPEPAANVIIPSIPVMSSIATSWLAIPIALA